MSATSDVPNAPKKKRTNWEMVSWLFMRISGVLLIVLIFGHLFVNLMIGEGINRVDFAFVAGKLATPFWRVWDLLMLWLAMIHGTNGVRTIINDYASKDLTRNILKGVLYVAFAASVILGTLVIFTFDPCPAGADTSLLPSFC